MRYYSSLVSAARLTLLPLHCSFFMATPAAEIYTLSLHDALPIWRGARRAAAPPSGRSLHLPVELEVHAEVAQVPGGAVLVVPLALDQQDRKSTRLNSSH